MKKLIILALSCAVLHLAGAGLAAAENTSDTKTDTKTAVKTDAKTQLNQLVAKISAKIKENKKTEADLAPLIKEFDTLLAQYKDEKTDDVARILYMKAMLYAQVLDNLAKAKELLNGLKTDFPETSVGKKVDDILKGMDKQEEAKKIQRALVAGAAFPDFAVTDMNGKPLSVANYKGKVVLIDFWATWCGPCVAELPNVLKTYKAYHDKGFEIIGISLDSKKEALTDFIAKKEMTWPQYFDGLGWQNKLAGKYGVNSIPATYLLDSEGKIIDKNLRGESLEQAVAKALKK